MKKYIIQKLSNKCPKDYKRFKLITCENFRYSALQFLVPNIKEIKNINDFEEVNSFFQKEENNIFMKKGYDYLTQNNHLTPVGYQKVFNENGDFISIGGHFVDEFKNGKITKLQRGIHVRQDFTDPSNPKPVVMGAVLMWHFLDHLEKNKEHLDYDGVLLSSILVTNGRMVDFGLRHKLNVGDCKFNKERGTLEYAQPIGDYIERLPIIKGSLEVSINKFNKFYNPSRSVSNVSFENSIENYK